VDFCLCSTQFREWECAIQYSIIAAAATAIIITTYNISTTRDINEYCQFCPHTCILTPSAVFVNIRISGRDNAISPSPPSAFIRNTRTDAVHNTPPTTYIQRCEYFHKNLSTAYEILRFYSGEDDDNFFGFWHRVVS
jgi:hypothetical protein